MFRTRIGAVRLKNGAELRLLPSARRRTTEHTWTRFQAALANVRRLYAEDFGGYVVIPWTIDGRFNTFITCNGPHPHGNDLPVWAAEALRRHLAEGDARELLGL